MKTQVLRYRVEAPGLDRKIDRSTTSSSTTPITSKLVLKTLFSETKNPSLDIYRAVETDDFTNQTVPRLDKACVCLCFPRLPVPILEWHGNQFTKKCPRSALENDSKVEANFFFPFPKEIAQVFHARKPNPEIMPEL